MKHKTAPEPGLFHPLIMDKLHGRMLVAPAKKSKTNRQILLLYGHHASLERIQGIAEALADYGTVTVPDFPGFGGMESFSRIGEQNTIDAFADYLAAFVKMRYKNRRFTIAGMSFGFIVATRMLQKYPELAKKVDLMVSIVGFTHKDDFKLKKSTLRIWKITLRALAFPPCRWFFKFVILNPIILRLFYAKMPVSKNKFIGLSKEEFKRNINFEIYLWQCNDVKTWLDTAWEMLHVDVTHKKIPLPVHHVSVSGDHYFNGAVVEQHMRIIFEDFIEYRTNMSSHAPSLIADEKTIDSLFPRKLRAQLAS